MSTLGLDTYNLALTERTSHLGMFTTFPNDEILIGIQHIIHL